MISQFVFGCVFEAVSGGLLAWTWLRMRKSERERTKALEDCLALGGEVEAIVSETENLRGELGKRSQELEQQRAQLEALLANPPVKDEEARALEQRCRELEEALGRESELESTRTGRAEELANAAHARALALEVELGEANERLARHAQEIEGLTAKVGERDAALADAEQRHLRLEQDLERLHAEHVRVANEQQLQANGAGESADAEAARLRAELQAERERCAGLEARLGELDASLAERDRELTAASQHALACEAELAEHKRLAEERASTIATLSKRCEELDHAVREAAASERELSEQKLFAKDREVHIESLARRCEELERAAAEANARRQAAVAEADVRLAEGRIQRESAENELAEGRRLAMEREVRIETLTRRCEELDRAAAEASARARREQRAAEERISACEARIAQDEKELAARTAELASLSNERASMSTRHEELVVRCGGLESELRRLAAELERSAEACRALERSADGHASESHRLAAEVARLELEGNTRREQAESLAATVRELEAELALQRHEHARAQADSRQARHRFEQAVASLEAERGELTRELEDARASVARLADELDSRAQLHAVSAARAEGLERTLAEEREESTRRANELEAATKQRVEELELRLCGATEAADGLRRDAAQLTERCRSLWALVETRARELGEREQALDAARTSAEALAYAVDTCREEIEKRDQLVDEWTDAQLEALLRRRLGSRPGPLPEACERALATGDLEQYLAGLLGEGESLAPQAVSFLCERWQREWCDSQRLPIDRELQYLWTESLDPAARNGDAEAGARSFLFALGAFSDGTRSVLAIRAGDPSGPLDWLELLSGLEQRGMNEPRLVVGAAESGVWQAIERLGWNCARQHCWTRAGEAVLAALPRPVRARVAPVLRALVASETRRAEKLERDRLVKRCGRRHAAAASIVVGDWNHLTAFRAFPKDDWAELRDTGCLTRPLAALHLLANPPVPERVTPHAEGIFWRLLAAAVRTSHPVSAIDPGDVDRVPSLVREPAAESGMPAHPAAAPDQVAGLFENGG